MLRLVPLLLLFIIGATPVSAQPQAVSRLPVVVTFSVLADMVRQVGGDRIAVISLVGTDADAHVYQPKPGDAKALAQAKLVITNGLGFEGWMDRLVRAAGYKGPVAVATTGVETLADGNDRGHSHGKAAHTGVNAHAWQSLVNGEVYARNIVEALSAADPEGAAAFRRRGEAYAAEMRKLHEVIRADMAAIPADQRRIITTHEALAYFGRDYGIEMLAATGISTEAEPTASNIARLTRQIKDKKVRAVFLESMTSGKLIEQLARNSGAVVGGTLYTDALSKPGGPAATYLSMIRHNARTIKDALTPRS